MEAEHVKRIKANPHESTIRDLPFNVLIVENLDLTETTINERDLIGENLVAMSFFIKEALYCSFVLFDALTSPSKSVSRGMRSSFGLKKSSLLDSNLAS